MPHASLETRHVTVHAALPHFCLASLPSEAAGGPPAAPGRCTIRGVVDAPTIRALPALVATVRVYLLAPEQVMEEPSETQIIEEPSDELQEMAHAALVGRIAAIGARFPLQAGAQLGDGRSYILSIASSSKGDAPSVPAHEVGRRAKQGTRRGSFSAVLPSLFVIEAVTFARAPSNRAGGWGQGPPCLSQSFHPVEEIALAALKLAAAEAAAVQDGSKASLECKSPRTPMGVLLVGPPGVGKTHAVRTLARRLAIPLIVINGPEILSPVPGESEAALCETFARAAALARPLSILFIDEIVRPQRPPLLSSILSL